LLSKSKKYKKYKEATKMSYEGSYQIASVKDRILGGLIDVGLALVITVPAAILGAVLAVVIGDGIGALLNMVCSLGGAVAYIAFQWTKFWVNSTSFGKSKMNMKVVKKATDENVTTGNMLLRELVGYNISSLICMLGYIWIFIDKDKQTWHDKILGTVVVKN